MQPYSDRVLAAEEFHRQIYPQWELISHDLVARCILHLDPAPSQRVEILNRMGQFWHECFSTRAFREIHIAGILDAWCTPGIDLSALQQFVDVTDELAFQAPITDSPALRTMAAVRKEILQLPATLPGFLVLRPPEMAIAEALQRGTLVELGRAAAAQLAGAPQVNGLALTFSSLGRTAGGNSVRVLAPDVELFSSPEAHIYLRHAVVAWNVARRFPEADAIIRTML